MTGTLKGALVEGYWAMGGLSGVEKVGRPIRRPVSDHPLPAWCAGSGWGYWTSGPMWWSARSMADPVTPVMVKASPLLVASTASESVHPDAPDEA